MSVLASDQIHPGVLLNMALQASAEAERIEEPVVVCQLWRLQRGTDHQIRAVPTIKVRMKRTLAMAASNKFRKAPEVITSDLWLDLTQYPNVAYDLTEAAILEAAVRYASSTPVVTNHKDGLGLMTRTLDAILLRRRGVDISGFLSLGSFATSDHDDTEE